MMPPCRSPRKLCFGPTGFKTEANNRGKYSSACGRSPCLRRRLPHRHWSAGRSPPSRQRPHDCRPSLLSWTFRRWPTSPRNWRCRRCWCPAPAVPQPWLNCPRRSDRCPNYSDRRYWGARRHAADGSRSCSRRPGVWRAHGAAGAGRRPAGGATCAAAAGSAGALGKRTCGAGKDCDCNNRCGRGYFVHLEISLWDFNDGACRGFHAGTIPADRY